jgi:hypothetical protein
MGKVLVYIGADSNCWNMHMPQSCKIFFLQAPCSLLSPLPLFLVASQVFGVSMAYMQIVIVSGGSALIAGLLVRVAKYTSIVKFNAAAKNKQLRARLSKQQISWR